MRLHGSPPQLDVYLTAHRVRTREGGRDINAVLYTHRDSSLPSQFWEGAPDEVLETVTTREPGRRIAGLLKTIPSGRSVECFIDVVAPDGTSHRAIELAIDELRRRVEASDATRVRVTVGGVITEFSIELGERSSRVERLNELAAAALHVHANRPPVTLRAAQALTIEVMKDTDGVRFRLTDAARERVDQAGGAKHVPTTMSIRSDIRDSFEVMHGPIYPHVAEWLTGLSREKLLDLGGASFVEGERVLFEWPARV